MVVCKFFQQGSCRYGQNCRFEHIYGSKYSYHANPSVQTQQAQTASIGTDEQLVNQVQSDILAALKGGQWILSSYAPFKEKPGYPGLSDLSPEEARLFIYEARANNTVDQAVAYMDNLLKETKYKYEQLLQPTANTIKILRSLFKGEVVSPQTAAQTSAFGTKNSAASSIFRNALNSAPVLQNANTSVFNQNANPSVFGGPPQDVAAKSIFAQANQATFGQQTTSPSFFQTSPNETTPKSLFAQENQKLFGTNQTMSNNPASIFASATQSIFGKPSDSFRQSNTPFQSQPQSNIFQKQDQPKADIFQKAESQNIFGTANNIFEQKSNTGDDNVYSKLEELSQDDLEAFKSNDFTLGFVPEIPPPQSLCI
ncbi:unnamed protein product [Parnassius apollo]|uniref:Nucleoporin NUP42 n=1 Tax=Parnassius apollo TaxID=110799 RepID=A0A8S3W748_PARAO|nr:unnamed protein product [Parnassius apollo]